MKKKYSWNFPLPRTHTGMLLGNGTIGAMVWGEKNVLRITLGRADFWDHRGGLTDWKPEMTFTRLREILEAGDEARLKQEFLHKPDANKGEPAKPSVLPVGRLELVFARDAELVSGELDIGAGVISIKLKKGGIKTLSLVLHPEKPVLAVRTGKGVSFKVKEVPAWEYVGDFLASVSFRKPAKIKNKNLSGWVQECPVDPALGVGYRAAKGELLIVAERGRDVQAASANCANLLRDKDCAGFAALSASAAKWWKKYWASVPTVEVPNPALDMIYHYGMYKFAGLTNPCGTPATLQGPWIEEYQMPPWQSDYHFNINVQLCYAPAFHGNRLEHLLPLFRMVHSWTPRLRANAKAFVGIDDGIMLPHAVDDRCTCMGNFWTGMIDHGCTAWVGAMMYRYYRYSQDKDFLREIAWPFMRGAMRVYEAMLEEKDGKLSLPVSVSPEFGGSSMNAWGRNASFQLACIHRLCEDLLGASEALGEKPEASWLRIREQVPLASTVEKGGSGDAAYGWSGKRIGLWEGLPLVESHRHHSHLAGINPFDVFDLDDPEWREIIKNSLGEWVYQGMGLWSGWGTAWAASIHARVENAEAAELMLEIWERVFTNEGRGTLHDVSFSGITLMGRDALPGKTHRPEVMQMDAGMAATAAVQEMLLHTRRGVTHVFPAAPARWENVSFKNMRTDGAFLVSAARTGGIVEKVELTSLAGGTLQLANPWEGAAKVSTKNGKTRTLSGKVFVITAGKGEEITLKPGR